MMVSILDFAIKFYEQRVYTKSVCKVYTLYTDNCCKNMYIWEKGTHKKGRIPAAEKTEQEDGNAAMWISQRCLVLWNQNAGLKKAFDQLQCQAILCIYFLSIRRREIFSTILGSALVYKNGNINALFMECLNSSY